MEAFAATILLICLFKKKEVIHYLLYQNSFKLFLLMRLSVLMLSDTFSCHRKSDATLSHVKQLEDLTRNQVTKIMRTSVQHLLFNVIY